jgi:uncharacterized protein (TIGR02266 family)
MGEEQRRHSRKMMQVTIHARDSQGIGQLVFTSADLSAGGMFLTSELLLEDGEALSLEFMLAGLATPIYAQAKVAWVRRFPSDGEPAGMGVQFLSLSDADRSALVTHLDGGPSWP